MLRPSRLIYNQLPKSVLVVDPRFARRNTWQLVSVTVFIFMVPFFSVRAMHWLDKLPIWD